MNNKEIILKAYELMNESIIEGDCGKLCNYHCCRNTNESGEDMGIYLLPLEYELILRNTEFSKKLVVETHSCDDYYINPTLGSLYYMVCNLEKECMRDLRPIQCRTYPFEPMVINNQLKLVVQKEQDHKCPLISKKDTWRKAFIKGIYLGWEELLKISEIKAHIEYDSKLIIKEKNYQFILDKKDIFDTNK